MKKYPGDLFNCTFLLLILLLVFTDIFAAGADRKTETRSGTVPNLLMIKLRSENGLILKKNNAPESAAAYLSRRYQISRMKPVFTTSGITKNRVTAFHPGQIFYAYYEGSQSPEEKARQMTGDPDIVYAEPKYINYISETPDDSLYSLQSPSYQVVSAPAAWQVVKGGQGNVIIAIVDGGTDIHHKDLAANIWTNVLELNGTVGEDDDGNGYTDDVYGWNFANNTGDPSGSDITPVNQDHGTHTAGIASAVTNNHTGVAGMAWNAKIMAVNCSDPATDRTIIYGYEGIIYAAENGADVINCSWGRSGTYSSFEADMIAIATSMGSVVVAAAGNNASNVPQYPASYKNVLAIAGTDASDNKYAATNYGDFVDLAAPAVNIYNCKHGNQYGYSTGTSMSSPMAAGAVALVKTQNPDWLGIQAAEQVRVTADLLPAYGSDLGRGRLNAFRAATETSPSIRITRFDYTDDNDNRIIEPGEQVTLHVTLINYLAGAAETSIHLQTADPYITIQQAESQLAGLSTLEEKELTPAFVFSVADNAPGAHYVTFDLLIGSGIYQDRDHITVTILPSFGDLDINNLAVTVTNIGRIGHPNPDQPAEGVGFSYKSGADLLFEGALICGTGESRLSNAARDGSGGFDQDFTVAPGGDISILTPGTVSDQESLGIFNDSQADLPLPVRLTQATYAVQDSANSDYVIFLYTILNNSSSLLSNFYFGLFFDWDIDGGNYATNVIHYDAGRQLGFAYDTGSGPDTYTGIVSLNEAAVSFRAIVNDNTDPANPDWGIYDGFTDAEKWASISGGITYTSAGPADVSMVIGNGPFNIPAKSVQRVAYAVLAADDSLKLMRAADSARAKWGRLIVTDMAGFTPVRSAETFQLSQNYPNPFNPFTSIRYALPEADFVDLSIYNVLGQKVATLVHQTQTAGKYRVNWSAAGFASGVYYYRLTAGDLVRTKKMIVLK